MWTEKKHPKWWQLYVILPLLVGLFWPEMRAALTEPEHVIAEIGILFLIFGFVQVWLRANRSALMNLDEEEGQWRIHVYQIPPTEPRAPDDVEQRTSQRPVFQIPVSEIKGVLSDTFEWEAPEGEASVFADQRGFSRKER